MLAERRKIKVVGLDFSLDAANVAWRRAGVPAVCATLSRAPLAPGSCAAITMFHVLEHLYDPASYLECRARAAAPGWPPDRPGSQRRLLAVSAVRRALERNRRAAPSDRFPTEAIWTRCWIIAVSRFCATSIFRCATIPPGMATSLAPGLDPMARRLRHVEETPRQRLWKDLAVRRAGVRLPPVHAARSRLPRRVHHHGGGAQKIVIYDRLRRRDARAGAPLRPAFRGVD